VYIHVYLHICIYEYVNVHILIYIGSSERKEVKEMSGRSVVLIVQNSALQCATNTERLSLELSRYLRYIYIYIYIYMHIYEYA
jgi:hypothetical protein